MGEKIKILKMGSGRLSSCRELHFSFLCKVVKVKVKVVRNKIGNNVSGVYQEPESRSTRYVTSLSCVSMVPATQDEEEVGISRNKIFFVDFKN